MPEVKQFTGPRISGAVAVAIIQASLVQKPVAQFVRAGFSVSWHFRQSLKKRKNFDPTGPIEPFGLETPDNVGMLCRKIDCLASVGGPIRMLR